MDLDTQKRRDSSCTGKQRETFMYARSYVRIYMPSAGNGRCAHAYIYALRVQRVNYLTNPLVQFPIQSPFCLHLPNHPFDSGSVPLELWSPSSELRTPLHSACSGGHIEVARYLITENGVDPSCDAGPSFRTNI